MKSALVKLAEIVGGWVEDPRSKPRVVVVEPPPKNQRKTFPYQGVINFQGLKIYIENKKNSFREGTDKSGHRWKTVMHAHYGEILGTKGRDKDRLDVYVGDNPNAKEAYIVHQNHPGDHPTKAGQYDEDKAILGVDSAEEAKKLYLKQYDRADFFRSITTMPMDQFKKSIFEDKGEKIASVQGDTMSNFEKLSAEQVYQLGVQCALEDMGLMKRAAGAGPIATVGAAQPRQQTPPPPMPTAATSITPKPPQGTYQSIAAAGQPAGNRLMPNRLNPVLRTR